MSSSHPDPHDPVPPAGPNPLAVALRAVLKPLASLRLTVVLLALGIGLVFFGTLAQKTAGMWTVIDTYFWSWLVMIDLQPSVEFLKIFFGLSKDATAPSGLRIPFPGGKLIGGLMFLNLLAAHATRFQLTWKRTGIWMAHGGLLLLFVGEFITREFQVEQQMSITEGQSTNFAIDTRDYEIAFIDPSDGDAARVTVVSAERFRRALDRGTTISHPDLPVDLEPLRYFPNSELIEPTSEEAAKVGENLATTRFGLKWVAVRRNEVSGVDNTDKRDFPSVYVRFLDKKTGEPVGTYLLSMVLNEQSLPVGDKTVSVSLRNVHYYKPFTLRLDHFTYEVYPGTTMAKNYASELTLIDPERGPPRSVVVSMNNPLFHRGEAFYQHQFNQTPAGRMTVLQIVRNPGWLLPYIACSMVGLGLLFHFVLGLTQYLRRQRTGTAGSPAWEGLALTVAGLAVVALLVRFGLIANWLDGVLGPVGSTNLLAELFGFLALTAVLPGVAIYMLVHRSRGPRPAATGAAAADAPTLFERMLPWGVVGLGALMLVGAVMPQSNPGDMDVKGAGRLPVMDGGRMKPLDTVARVYLRKISAREEFETAEGKKRPAIQWLLDTMVTHRLPAGQGRVAFHGPAAKHRVIRIEHAQVLTLLGLDRREGYRYSLEEIGPRYNDLVRAHRKVEPEEGEDPAPTTERIDKLFETGDRDVFEAQLKETYQRVNVYVALCEGAIPMTLPPDGRAEWRSPGRVQQAAANRAVRAALAARDLIPPMLRSLTEADWARMPPGTMQLLISYAREQLDDEDLAKVQREVRELSSAVIQSDPSAAKWDAVLDGYAEGSPLKFSGALASFREATRQGVTDAERAKVGFEVFLNAFAPAYQVIYLYVFAGLLALAGWGAIAFRPTLAAAFQKSAFWLLVLTFVIHGFALFARMYLMDRPLVFVTNLYSTAVFIGWSAVGLGLVMERIVPIGLGNLAAAVVGGVTAIIAHNLATSGDTLEMMQAVLDTNFWLATHVTTINLGYAATYVAGVIGITYLLLGVFTPALSWSAGVGVPGVASRRETLGRLLGQVMYGVVCLATLLSFVGTVLGGIWADYSWGRFWGWDPKENGAILIVLWNALILHARWSGLVKDRGMAVLTLGGNMITTWSYFGTNQLGVGLHNYGFNKTLATGCMVVWMVHLALVGVGSIPLRYWRSYANAPAPQAATATAAPTPAAGDTAPPRPTTATDAAPPATNGPAAPNGHAKPGKGRKHGKRR